MPTQASLTVTNGNTITATWGNAMRDSVVLTCTSSTRPASPHEGMTAFETDTDRAIVYTGSAWIVLGWIGSAGRIACALTAPTPGTTPVPTSSLQILNWGTETYDPVGMHGAGSSDITAVVGGAYMLSLSLAWTTFWVRSGDFVRLLLNGGTLLADLAVESNTSFWSCSFGPFDMASGDRVSASVFQTSGTSRSTSAGTMQLRYLSA